MQRSLFDFIPDDLNEYERSYLVFRATAEGSFVRESEIGAVRMVRSASRLNARRVRASGNVALNSVRRRHGVSRRNSGPKIQGTREYAR